MMTRFRVSLVGPMGRSWFDVYDRDEAISRAKAEERAGARGVEVMEEKPWPPGKESRYTANFVTVWPYEDE